MKTSKHSTCRTISSWLLLPAFWLGFSTASLAELSISGPGNGDFTWNLGSKNTYGWNFTVGSVGLRITALGIWDSDLDGLAAAHSVGLWTDSEVLLASTVVKSGTQSPLIGEFRLEQLPSALTLVSGATYTIGAFYGGDDFFHASFASPPVSSSAISNLVARYEFGNSLTRPTQVFGLTPYVGPTFEFTLVPQTNGPILRIVRSEANPNAVLFWSTNDAGFTLQSTTNLSHPIIWASDLPSPIIVSGQYRVTVPFGAPQKFYRLSKP